MGGCAKVIMEVGGKTCMKAYGHEGVNFLENLYYGYENNVRLAMTPLKRLM